MHTSVYSFEKLFESIHVRYGYDFTNYTYDSLSRRCKLFMHSLKMDSLEDFAALVLEDEYTFEEFIKSISVTVTEMFRDPSFYLSLREKVIPRLAAYPFIKIWIAGCATGEEAYSMAILLEEENLLDRSIIYATDINQKSLQIASQGVYPISTIQLYTTNYLRGGGEKSFSEYYTAKYDLAIFDKLLRNHIVFAPHNLTDDESFNEFQIIVCRNVLIYFNSNLQNRVLELFHDSLSPFGFLGLGSSETLLFSSRKEYFDEVDRKERIFSKRDTEAKKEFV